MKIKLELTQEQTVFLTELLMSNNRHTRSNLPMSASIIAEIERGLAQMFNDNAEWVKERTGVDISVLTEDSDDGE